MGDFKKTSSLDPLDKSSQYRGKGGTKVVGLQ